MQGNQAVELTEDEHWLARASFIHLMFDNCCGVLVFKGEFPSRIAEDAVELVFECGRCRRKVVLL